IRRDLSLTGGGRGRTRTRRHENVVLVLDGCEGQPGCLGVGVIDVAHGAGSGLHDLSHPAVPIAASAGRWPADGRGTAELPDSRRRLDQELREVLRGTGGVRAPGDGDRGAEQVNAWIDRPDRRI